MGQGEPGAGGARRVALTRRGLLAGVTAASLAGACGRTGELRPGVPPPALGGRDYRGPRVELAFWNGFTGGDGPFMRRLVEDFNAAHPRVRVVMNAIRWDEFYRKVPVAVAHGRGPDVGVMQQHQLPLCAARGVVVPLDALAREFGLREEDFFAPAWNGGAFQGQRYGLPLDVHPLGMFYNRRAFAAAGLQGPPETGEALGEALARLKRSGFTHPFWLPTLWPAHLMFQSLLWQFGGAPFSADASRVTFAGDAGVRAVEWMTGLYRRGYSPASVALDAQWNAFLNGTNAVVWDGVWMVHNVRDVPGGAGVAPLPRVGPHAAAWGNAHHGVLFGRPRLDAARVQAGMVFLAWLSQHSLAWAQAGQVPARNRVREGPGFAALEAQATFARQLPTVRLPPSGLGIGELHDDVLVYAVDSVLRGADPRGGLEKQRRLASDRLRTVRALYRS
jgi:multiple sugar transport system substrate-binding protein